MKRNGWITVMILGLSFFLAGFCANCAEASNVKGIQMELRTDIKKYDVTGDGEKDVVRIESEKPIRKNKPIEGPWIVKINGDVAYRSNPKHHTEYLTVVLYQIRDDMIYLNITEEVGANDDINSCAFYQYQSGGLKKVCDVCSPMTQHKSLLHFYVTSMKVNDKEIKVSYSNQFSVTGYLNWSAVYRYENGVWKLNGNVYSTTAEKTLTANRKITIYKKPGGTGKAFTLTKGQKVGINKICLKNKKAYVRVELPNGKKGWMESPGKQYGDGYFFKEVVFAG